MYLPINNKNSYKYWIAIVGSKWSMKNTNLIYDVFIHSFLNIGIMKSY